MADKKLNEVPVVNDIVTIFGKRSNGEIVQIDKSNLATLLGELIGINDSWLRFRDVRSIESQDKLDSMQSSGMYALSDSSQLEYVRNCILVVIGYPSIVCVQKLYNYNGIIYKYRVKWYSNTWSNWQTVSLT